MSVVLSLETLRFRLQFIHHVRSRLTKRTSNLRLRAVEWCNSCVASDAGSRLFSTSLPSGKSKNEDFSSLFIPAPLKLTSNPDDINVGEELVGQIKKDELIGILAQFYKRPPVKLICEENGLDNKLFHQAYTSFRRFCMESETLPADLHVVLSDILQGAGHVDDLMPYFLRHAKQIFPHLECMDDLKKISDLRLPANWYPEARALNRKIVFHAGPTNSGKTYHALERFISSKSGVYCGPLKLLAVEVHAKTNAMGTPCDLITGEERRFANQDKSPSNHVACTVEMASVTTPYEVAIVDEIQMMKDNGRGWAWTRALLGIAAEEVHVCGEAAAIELVKELCLQIGEEFEVRKYKRLTKLTVENQALERLSNVQPGDCIVCFSKNDIYHVSREIEKLGKQCAVIYGGLPPGTKLAQAKKFNNPDDPCKIMVATDAIGMGLNLSIRRIIFYSLIKPVINEKGEKEMDTISTSQALQIGGRAGRYGTQFDEGHITTFKKEDLQMLKSIMNRPVEEVENAGLHPTADQIELFAYHLPHATLSNLIDIFVSLCEVDHSRYFICNVDDFKFLADMIQHVPLPLRARYVFCCAPINRKMPFVCTHFLKFARQYSKNEALTLNWLCNSIGWPFVPPQTIIDLVHLEAVFDVLDLYLWLSYRFPDLFPDGELVRDMQKELDEIIQIGVVNITRLLKVSESDFSSGTNVDVEEGFEMKNANNRHKRGLMAPTRDGGSSGKSRAKIHDDNDNADIYVDNAQYIRMMEEKQGNGKPEHRVLTGRGRLTERLVSEGYITLEMIDKLKNEWKQEIETSNRSKKPPRRK